jgi:hypothetical protein
MVRARLGEFISERTIRSQALCEHPAQDRQLGVDVVVDEDVPLAGMDAV